ncbi:phosphomevalonate kinase [Lacticaseibacillus saniviri]|uniref:phosphomevalonate kinase n=1 Tax=Lacticaseibacillus saniviri TaxID=931533 RepID=UPI0006D1683F|nr:phosphomevalonate kinase [Lacticaseibacillus saniviri]MCG4282129.1 phosphomevalonate kinase [Lacticaseibacillus saniviri]
MVTAQAPGKLYIAGEYAVVETGFPAIIVALNQFVTVTVEAKQQYGSIVSNQYQENSLVWKREGDQMVFDNRDNPFHYILSAIHLTEDYARELGKPLALYQLSVDSDLDAVDGRKFGLGSSAAVTVATVKALNLFYELNMSADQIYKLAAIAHLDVQGNGSLGDIAASVYGGWIAYRSFDKEWLAAQRHEATLSELLNMDWPELSIKLLTPPDNMRLLIGWTGSPASTSQLVDKITIAKAQKKAAYQQFLADSKAVLEDLIASFNRQDLAGIQAGIRANRHALDRLADFSGVAIETPVLKKMRQLAENFGGCAKTSGAGGGDCGIVLIDQDAEITPLLDQWRANQIEPLNFEVHEIK